MNNPPKKPDWRWLTHHALLERDKDGVDEAILRYARHLKQNYDDTFACFKAIDTVYLLEYEKYEDNDDLERALQLRDEPPIRRLLEEMLLEQCDIEMIQEALYHKFKETLSVEALTYYRDLFWDTEYLNAYDFGQYFEDAPEERPDPPAVQGKWRPHYRMFQNGGTTNLDMDDAMSHMFQRAFFRSEELARLRAAGDDRVLKYQRNAVKIFKALQEKESNQDRAVDLPDAFEQEIEYPSETAIDPSELGDYDPHEDPNE